ncbi:MAG TPA: hypothetical protein VGO14_11855, partial [Solirubrobacteraceae bacterium]|nr:hypothetical protein [Solirubrobacteraceae bacterium]
MPPYTPPYTALPIVAPFIAATALTAVRPLTRRWFNDIATCAVVAGVITLCALLLSRSAARPLAYWMGGWTPSHGVTIGISLSVDPIGAGLALFAGVLVVAALLYSLHYFDDVDGVFHVLMLLFCAAMVGFCLTGDLFNLV